MERKCICGMNQSDIDRSLNLDQDIQTWSPTVKFPIYSSYDMDLVDLIIFTVGDPRGCWNELHAMCNGSIEMRIVATWLWSLFKMILQSQRKWSES